MNFTIRSFRSSDEEISKIQNLSKTTKYLWCVNHYGPNNQLRDFIKCCIIAMINNFTLIIPPLYPHHADKLRGIQWFDHFYDLKQLRLAVNFVTFDEILSQHQNSGKILIDCYIEQIQLVSGRKWYSHNTLMSMQNAYKVKINFQRYVNLTRNFDMKELVEKSKFCSTIFLHIHYMTLSYFFYSSNVHLATVFKNLRRTSLIQRMASKLKTLLPEIGHSRNVSQKRSMVLAAIHMRLGDYVVMNVSSYLEKVIALIKSGVKFTHIHIMCPYLTPADMNLLSSILPVTYTTTQDLSKYLNVILDDYLFDVLEQELAYQAEIFIASPWTTYSATILLQKVHQKQGLAYLISNKNGTTPFLITEKNAKYY